MVEVAAPQNWTHFIKVPLQIHPSPCTSNLLPMNASLGFGFGGLDVVATCQVACEDLLTTKAKALSSKHMQKRKTTTFTLEPPIPPLNTPSSNKSTTASLSRKEPQGPLLMDNNLELDVDFPLHMVIEMQKGATKKARKMVI
jgi:hypothetical protein